MALIAAEQAAQEKAQESPEAKEALEPAISAAEGVIAAAPLIDDLPDDLGELTRALRTAVSASRLADITRWAAEAAEIGRRAEIEMYARIEAQEDAANEREVEAFALAMIEDDRAALKRAVEKFLKQVKRRK